jgi:hypothetical protein
VKCRFARTASFFYLTQGVTEPRASVIIDGRAGTTTVFLQPRTVRQDASQYGPGMNPGAEAATALGRAGGPRPGRVHGGHYCTGFAQQVIYTPFAAEVLGSQSQGDPTRLWAPTRRIRGTDVTRAKRLSLRG